ncbi:MAG: tRNA-dihydrouridine synthase family protein [Verrucomicrobia bacterium]|nr:tRNA-dihydrouridine synthase family protein [Verrucomicrobiota bacterium]
MQEVTDLAFMRVLEAHGHPDLYFTEYFRVHAHSRLDRHILRSITENPTGRPVVAQMIGEDIERLVATAEELQRYEVAGIDLNLGCPAPCVCSKHSGGGLLRNPAKVDAILAALRSSIRVAFTVKTRIGYESPEEFDNLLEIFARHRIDLLSVHGRTVAERYHSAIHYDRIRSAVERLPCPVLANGNVVSLRTALLTLEKTGAAGLMIGRGAIRHPWIFAHLRHYFDTGTALPLPDSRELRKYIERLYRETRDDEATPFQHVTRMKRYLNFIAPGLGQEERFLYEMKRVREEAGFFEICDRHLRTGETVPAEPPPESVFAGLAALDLAE